MSYTKNFKNRGHNLKLNYSWSDNLSDNIGNYNEPITDLKQRTNQNSDRYDQSIRIDYTHPFNENKGKLEIGYKRDYDKMNSSYEAEQLFDERWRVIPPSNTYDYYQDVHALYIQLGNKSGKISYQAGLRYEDTDFFANLIDTDETTSLNYSNFFPSAFITYEFRA